MIWWQEFCSELLAVNSVLYSELAGTLPDHASQAHAETPLPHLQENREER